MCLHAEKGHQFLLWKGLSNMNDASDKEDLVGRTQSPGCRTLPCILQRQDHGCCSFVFGSISVYQMFLIIQKTKNPNDKQ